MFSFDSVKFQLKFIGNLEYFNIDLRIRENYRHALKRRQNVPLQGSIHTANSKFSSYWKTLICKDFSVLWLSDLISDPHHARAFSLRESTSRSNQSNCKVKQSDIFEIKTKKQLQSPYTCRWIWAFTVNLQVRVKIYLIDAKWRYKMTDVSALLPSSGRLNCHIK